MILSCMNMYILLDCCTTVCFVHAMTAYVTEFGLLWSAELSLKNRTLQDEHRALLEKQVVINTRTSVT